ncbi:MAG: DPP IV N-terminal domain-containing protein, partial [Bacteroidales bacterium]|nr:DPP IV N-terminal domain-containing protein [Bacteroidales bacterium]
MKKLTLLFAVLQICATALTAQNKMLTSNDLMSGSLYPSRVRFVQFVGKTNRFAFVRDNALYIGTSSSQKELLKLETLSKAFQSLENNELYYFPAIKFVNDKEFSFVNGVSVYLYNIKTKTLSKAVTIDASAESSDIDPNTYQVAYTIGNSLYVNSRQQVFTVGEGGDGIVYGQSVHRSEFGIEKGTFWSPQGNLLAFYRMDESMVTDYPMVNTATRITTATPIKYPMAGMKSHEVTVGIFNTLKGTTTYLNTRRDTTVAEREMYLTNLSWSPDEKTLYIAKINREQNHMWLESYDVETGELIKVLFEEKNDRYMEPVDGLYFLPTKPDQFLWLSY